MLSNLLKLDNFIINLAPHLYSGRTWMTATAGNDVARGAERCGAEMGEGR
jgi:hypothetical protein